jgi:hypothetical protein
MVTGPENFAASFDSVQMYLYTDESFADDAAGVPLERENGRWMFSIGGTGFDARLGIQLEHVGAATV